jgi:OOP family OmpA-OmpF porin
MRLATALLAIAIAAAADSAASLAREIEANGRVAVYGIVFEDDKDYFRPESRAAIEQVAALLKARPEMRLHIVAHTDSLGDTEYFLHLSWSRAKAVLAALVRDHGIAESRLEPHGAGPLFPVASNRTAAGRAKNRRIELVER